MKNIFNKESWTFWRYLSFAGMYAGTFGILHGNSFGSIFNFVWGFLVLVVSLLVVYLCLGES